MNKPVKLPFEFNDLGKDGTRTGTIHFMKVFSVMVKNGKRPPDDYLECAAQLLGAAADAAKEPVSKKRATAIMKAINLSGRVDKGYGYRDLHIARAMLYLIEFEGESHRGASTRLSVELEDFGVAVPEQTLLSIFKRYPQEELEQNFYGFITSLVNLGRDPAEYVCNYETLAHFFR